MTTSAPRTWRIDLPVTAPLSLNDRGHWRPSPDRTTAVYAVVIELPHDDR